MSDVASGEEESLSEESVRLRMEVQRLSAENERLRQAQGLSKARAALLDAVGWDQPVAETLAALKQALEDHRPGWTCDFLLHTAVTGRPNSPSAPDRPKPDFALPFGSSAGESLGALEAWFEESQSLDDEEVDLLGAAARLAASAIERTRDRDVRREVDDLLRKSEERFRGLMEQAPFSMQLLSHDGRTIAVNRAFEDLWGLRLEQLADYLILEDPQLHAKGIFSLLRRAFAGQATTLPEILYEPEESLPDLSRHSDSGRWISAVAFPIKDASGEVREVALIHQDVTERKLAEEAARRAEQRLTAVLASVGDHLVSFDRDWRYVYANERAAELLGRTQEELIGKRVWDLLPDAIGEEFYGEAHRAVERREAARFENYYAPFGKWFENYVYPTDEGVTVFSADITWRKRAEAEERTRQQNEALYRSILDSVSAVVYVKDLDGKYLLVNRHYGEILGVEPDGMIGRTDFDYFNPETADSFRRNDQEVLAQGRSLRVEEVAPHADGSHTYVSLKFPLKTADGEIYALCGVSTDIEDRKRAERLLDRYRLLSERTRDIVIFLRPDGSIVDANAAAVAAYGYSRDELLTMSLTDLRAPETLTELPGQLAAAADTGTRFESFHRRRDGSTFPVEVSSRGADVGGEPLLLSVVRDATDRRRAERQLVLSSRVLDSMAEGVSVTGSDGIIVYTNPAEDRIFGYGPGELIGKHVSEQNAYPPEENERIVGSVIETLKSEGIWTGDFLNRRKDGSPFTTACRISALDLEGATYFICVQEDVTEARRAENELRRQRKLLSTVADNADSALVMVDAQGKLTFVNPAFSRITGYQPEEVLGRSVHETVHYQYPDGRPFPVEECELDAAYRRNPASIKRREELFVRKDGTTFPVVVTIAPLEENGATVGCTAEFRDVTREKQAEASLIRNEHVSRFLADVSAALSELTDEEDALRRLAQFAVPRFADWCAIDLLEEQSLRRVAVAHSDPDKLALAQEYHDRFPPDKATSSSWRILRTGESQLVPQIEDAMLIASIEDQEQLGLLLKLGLRSYIGVPLKVRDSMLGVLTFVSAESGRQFDEADLALAEDLAARAAVAVENVRLYEDLREADRRKNDFLAMLGHELRNPLAPIRSGLDLLKLSGEEDEVVDLMSGQVDHLVRLVDDLLDVSRILRGRVELKRQVIDLQGILRRAIETIRPLFDAQRQRFVIDLPDEPARVDADPVRLTQIFTNLLHNASKYTEAGGSITLALERSGRHVTVSVADTGIGIDPHLLPHVFELFVQSARTIDRSQGGLGIGLTLVKSLVEMHGGTVAARSEGPGRGSRFEVRLPTLETEAKSPSSVASTPTQRTSRRVLVVDDNVPAAKLLVRLLGALGAQDVVTAHDGPGALVAAEAYAPDIILLDVGLPKLSGLEVARRLRSRPEFASTLLIALTGYGTEDDRRRSADAGFDDHLTKPPTLDALRALLERRKA